MQGRKEKKVDHPVTDPSSIERDSANSKSQGLVQNYCNYLMFYNK